ncbi:MAG: hypothetical protein H7Y20_14355 [Bryobacteraceae bacterium]|nr:hypothetical protein [Bryobacteraceae bacterium]
MVPPPLRLHAGLLTAFAVIAFGLCLGAGFVFDDFAIFTAAPLTRPFTWLTFRLNEAIGGQNPALFHAVNLALHLLAIWLARDALGRAIPARAADIGAILFALHPIQAEAVNYIWSRSTLLMTVFCLLSIRDWFRGRHWWAVAWFGVALLAKEECVALPLFFALLHLSISRNQSEWKPIGAMLVLSLVSGGYVLWAANVTPGSQAGAQSQYSTSEYLSSQGAAILHYFRLTLAPVGFTVDPVISSGQWIAWVPLIALACGAMFRFSKAREGFWFLAGLVLLLPSSSIFPANDLAADRRMYLPLFAFSAVVGILLQRIDRRVILVLALIFTGLSVRRSWVWQSDTRIWREAMQMSPGKVRPRIQLARTLPAAEAIPLLLEAQKIDPNNPLTASELGRVYLAMNEVGDSLAQFGKALALAPNSPQALSNRGVALLMLRQTDAARADFVRALSIEPCGFEALYNLKRLGANIATPAHCRYTQWQRESLAGVH